MKLSLSTALLAQVLLPCAHVVLAVAQEEEQVSSHLRGDKQADTDRDLQISFCSPPEGCRCGPADEVICPDGSGSGPPGPPGGDFGGGGFPGFPFGGGELPPGLGGGELGGGGFPFGGGDFPLGLGGGGELPTVPGGFPGIGGGGFPGLGGGFLFPEDEDGPTGGGFPGFPGGFSPFGGEPPVIPPPLVGGGGIMLLNPPIIAIGRPFIDGNGVDISTNAQVCERSLWSEPDASTTTTTTTSTTSTTMSDARRQELSAEWANRAVAEHASIASFAAFTVALMSNQAPPDLIRDSLQAAMDELGHATVSFEMAALLSGQPLEPGALPASQHSFDNDLAALARATVLEGCVGETLSALEMAAEVDEEEASTDHQDDLTVLLMDRTRTIALEEGRHSSLAWRTIHWVCSIDVDTCETIKEQVLTSTLLETAVEKRFASGHAKIEEAWTRIHETLVPFATGVEKAGVVESVDCSSSVNVEAEHGTLKRLTENIVRGVVCGVEEHSSSKGPAVLAASGGAETK